MKQFNDPDFSSVFHLNFILHHFFAANVITDFMPLSSTLSHPLSRLDWLKYFGKEKNDAVIIYFINKVILVRLYNLESLLYSFSFLNGSNIDHPTSVRNVETDIMYFKVFWSILKVCSCFLYIPFLAYRPTCAFAIKENKSNTQFASTSILRFFFNFIHTKSFFI